VGRPGTAAAVEQAAGSHRPVVVFDTGEPLAMTAARGAPVAIVSGLLGLAGSFTPLDGIVVDELGLANPLGARIPRNQPDRIGHEKRLPRAWVLADLVDPAAVPADQRAAVEAARRALGCGELAELFASVRAPMTPARFWANLTGSLRRTLLVIPAAPDDAERRFCR
jgi:arabinofuranosyltransferase